MRRPVLTLLVLATLTGCALIGAHEDGAPGARTAPRPRAASGPDTVGAAELGGLTITRSTALRQEPLGKAPPFGALKQGELVLHLDARGPWFRVWVPSVAMSGWIEKGTASRAKAETAGAAPVPVTELALVTAARSGARLRNGPSTKAAIIRALDKGEPLRLLRQEGAWAKVWDPVTREAGYLSIQLVERPR